MVTTTFSRCDESDATQLPILSCLMFPGGVLKSCPQVDTETPAVLEARKPLSAWSPIHLRDTLKKLYWRDGKDTVGAMAFWEDMQRYLYLPRLDDRHVLEQAIVKGAGSKDFFGTAYGITGAIFDGFKFGDANVQFDEIGR